MIKYFTSLNVWALGAYAALAFVALAAILDELYQLWSRRRSPKQADWLIPPKGASYKPRKPMATDHPDVDRVMRAKVELERVERSHQERAWKPEHTCFRVGCDAKQEPNSFYCAPHRDELASLIRDQHHS